MSGVATCFTTFLGFAGLECTGQSHFLQRLGPKVETGIFAKGVKILNARGILFLASRKTIYDNDIMYKKNNIHFNICDCLKFHVILFDMFLSSFLCSLVRLQSRDQELHRHGSMLVLVRRRSGRLRGRSRVAGSLDFVWRDAAATGGSRCHLV